MSKDPRPNPNSEIRVPKEVQNPKERSPQSSVGQVVRNLLTLSGLQIVNLQFAIRAGHQWTKHSNVLCSSFGFRPSDFCPYALSISSSLVASVSHSGVALANRS
jgi:hypothetical protein